MLIQLVDTAGALERELEWLGQVIAARYAISFNAQPAWKSVEEVEPPDVGDDHSFYPQLVRDESLSFAERLILILSLAPALRPALLDPLLVKNPDTDKPFTEFGGMHGPTHNGLIPTVQTALYLLAGDELKDRHRYLPLFAQDHLFFTRDLVRIGSVSADEPYLSGSLTASPDLISRALTGAKRKTNYSPDFPAREVTTTMTWDDLVLDASVLKQVNEIMTWLKYSPILMKDWGMERKIKPGYRCLFHGPPGTGKTLTATLMGKVTGKKVYQIDLSLIVSKYIGETEKNLSRVFDAAQNKDWILFFDEADALFGKRTKVSDSHDRYANQEVSYLLQRVEDYHGLVILATNLKSNIDDAFLRRFQTVVQFYLPSAAERLELWKACLPDEITLGEDVNLRQIAAKYEISGGSIINIVQYCALQALSKNNLTLTAADLVAGIRRELSKEGKTI